jgi:hypothetical protein
MRQLDRFIVQTRVAFSKTSLSFRCEANGSFYINGAATDAMGLVEGDRLVIIHDKELYLSKTAGMEGFAIRFYGQKRGAAFTSTGLRRVLMEILGLKSPKSFMFLLQESNLECTPYVKWLLKLEVHNG